MENISPINTTLKWGAINGLSTFAFFIILYFTGNNPLGSVSILGWALPVVLTLLAVRDHRNNDLGGYISYGRGVGTGMLVAIFSGFLFAVLMYVFINFYASNIPQMQIDDFYKNMEKVKGLIGEEKYDTIMQKFEANKSSFSPGNLAISSFEARIFGGLIISLIAAGIYKRTRPPFDSGETLPSNPG